MLKSTGALGIKLKLRKPRNLKLDDLTDMYLLYNRENLPMEIFFY